MSIDYSLTIHNRKNSLNPFNIIDHLKSTLSLEKNELSGMLMGKGYTVQSFIHDDEYIESFFGSAFPDLLVSFDINKFDSFVGIQNMMTAVFSVLSFLKEDLVFLFNGEEVIFKRLSGQLIINTNTDFWEVYDISISMPYKEEKFEIL